MNTGMIVLGAFLASICVLPFVAAGMSKKKLSKRVEAMLRALMLEHKASSSKEELVGRMAIALDESQSLLFFVKLYGDRNESIAVRMTEMKSCKLEKESRTVTNDNGSYQLIESLILRFIPVTKGASEVRIPIFKIEDDLHANDELALAERWSAIIDEQLRLRVPLQVEGKDQLPPKQLKATA